MAQDGFELCYSVVTSPARSQKPLQDWNPSFGGNPLLHCQGSVNTAGVPGGSASAVMLSEVTSAAMSRGYGRAMVRTMTAAGSVPHFHFHDDANMARLTQLRRELQLDPKAVKLTMLPFIIKVQDDPALPWIASLHRSPCWLLE